MLVLDLGLLVRRQFSWLRFALRLAMECMNEPDGPVVGLPRDLPAYHRNIRCRHKVIPNATSHNLGWIGLQAVRYWDNPTNEIHVPPLSQHLLILITRPPTEMNLRYEGVKRDIPPPAGSIMVMPVGSVTEWRWRGTANSLHIYLDPKLIAQVSTTSFELDLSRTAVESLANILAVHLIRYIFGLRRPATLRDGVLPRRKLATIVDYIMANLDGSPTLEQMAALVDLSPYHFARQFKAATGLPPHQFLIARRVEQAQQLLCGRGRLSLSDAAIRAGFSDQSQLSLHFKRIVGVTPGQFRASKIS